MANDYDIANLALSRIGHESSLTAFSSSGNKASRWFNTNYEIIKKAFLEEFPVRVATKRAVLTADTIYDITDATAANPVVITTDGSHGFSNGDTVYISGIVGMTEINNRTFTVANKAATTFELSGEDGSAYTAYSNGGKAYGYIANEYAYRYALPSDCLFVIRINAGYDHEYRVEGAYIYTDELSANSTIDLEYLFDETTDTNFGAMLVDTLASRFAAEICFYMTENTELEEKAWKIYQGKVRMFWNRQSLQGTPRNIEADAWIDARN